MGLTLSTFIFGADSIGMEFGEPSHVFEFDLCRMRDRVWGPTRQQSISRHFDISREGYVMELCFLQWVYVERTTGRLVQLPVRVVMPR